MTAISTTYYPLANNADPITAPAGSLFDKAVCLSVEIKKPSNRRAGDLDKVETDADRDMLSFGKKLVDCDELRAIAKIDGKIRKVLKQKCLPSPLRSGVYLLPYDLIEQVDAKLQELIEQRKVAVEAFLGVYPAEIELAKERLKSQFNPADYPPVEVLKANFGVALQFLTFGVPTSLSGVSKEIFERAKEQANARWAEATEQIQQALRQAMQELIGHMVERLTPGDDGKKKMFMASTLDNVVEFLDGFKSRNIANDSELEQLVAQAKEVLAGADAKRIRTDELFRGELRAKLDEVKQQLDGMLTDAPVRKMYFDEE